MAAWLLVLEHALRFAVSFHSAQVPVGDGGQTAEVHIVRQIAEFDFARDASGLGRRRVCGVAGGADAADAVHVGFAAAARVQVRGAHDGLRKTEIEQFVGGGVGVFQQVVQPACDFGLIRETSGGYALWMVPVVLAAFVDLTGMPFSRQSLGEREKPRVLVRAWPLIFSGCFVVSRTWQPLGEEPVHGGVCRARQWGIKLRIAELFVEPYRIGEVMVGFQINRGVAGFGDMPLHKRNESMSQSLVLRGGGDIQFLQFGDAGMVRERGEPRAADQHAVIVDSNEICAGLSCVRTGVIGSVAKSVSDVVKGTQMIELRIEIRGSGNIKAVRYQTFAHNGRYWRIIRGGNRANQHVSHCIAGSRIRS